MLPLRDVIPSRTFPLVTISLITLIALAWLYELTLSPRELTLFMREVGVVPAVFSWPAVPASLFFHGSWLQAIVNGWFLWIFGENVEDRMGHGRFLFFYLLCGAVAAFAYVWMDPDSPLAAVGASGAVGGVLGAYFVMYPQSRVLTLVPFDVVEIPATVLLGFWCLAQLISVGAIVATAQGQQGGIAFLAHLAGVLAGVAGVFVFRRRQSTSAPWMSPRLRAR